MKNAHTFAYKAHYKLPVRPTNLAIGKGYFCSSYGDDIYSCWDGGGGIGLEGKDFNKVKEALKEYAIRQAISERQRLEAKLEEYKKFFKNVETNPETWLDQYIIKE